MNNETIAAYMRGYVAALEHTHRLLGYLLEFHRDGKPLDSVLEEIWRQDGEIADALEE